jgi:histone H3/H4
MARTKSAAKRFVGHKKPKGNPEKQNNGSGDSVVKQSDAGTSGVTGVSPDTGTSGMTGVSPDTGTSGMTGVSPDTGTLDVKGVSPDAGTSDVTGVSPDAGMLGVVGIGETTSSGVVNKKESTIQQNQSKKRKKHKFHPGTVALREIRKFQKSTDNLLPRAPFERLVREILQELRIESYRVQRKAVDALQLSAEDFLVSVFEETNLVCLHRGRQTIGGKDIKLVRKIGCAKNFRK